MTETNTNAIGPGTVLEHPGPRSQLFYQVIPRELPEAIEAINACGWASFLVWMNEDHDLEGTRETECVFLLTPELYQRAVRQREEASISMIWDPVVHLQGRVQALKARIAELEDAVFF